MKWKNNPHPKKRITYQGRVNLTITSITFSHIHGLLAGCLRTYHKRNILTKEKIGYNWLEKLARGMRIEINKKENMKGSYVYHRCGISHKSGLISSFASSKHGNRRSSSAPTIFGRSSSFSKSNWDIS